MERFAVSVLPLAKPAEWRTFCDSIDHGERAEAHRAMLARLGVTHERVYHQSGAGPDLVVLIWEGVDQHDLAGKMAELIGNPQTDHERYVATHVIPGLHGIDPASGVPEIRLAADMVPGRVPATH